jgi:beta-galactosidase
MKKNLWLCMAFVITLLTPAYAFAGQSERDQSFDDDWRFHRGDAPGAEQASFDDAAWRHLDLPHDWSIEDLPPRTQDDVPVLSVRDGEWKFHAGDDASWSRRDYDDHQWTPAYLPTRWKEQPGFADGKGYAWCRRHISIPASQRGKNLSLDLSTIMGADETYFNGVRVGRTGSFPPDFEDYWSNIYQLQRTYPIPANLVSDGDNVVAVRMYSANPNVAGMYDAQAPVSRTGPFDPGASPGSNFTAHTVGGIGWYRKKFVLPRQESARRVALRFDGVYMDSDVWINGHLLGNHPYGYTSFGYDVTPYLNPAGEPNVVAVRVKNAGANSRWYSGSGIYRHTWLTITDPVHTALWGVHVTTPKIEKNSATVKVATTVENVGSNAPHINVGVKLVAPDGTVVAEGSASPAGGRASLPDWATPVPEWCLAVPGSRPSAKAPSEYTNVEQTLAVPNPRLWSPATPELYKAVVAVESDGQVVDETTTPFGIRSVQVDAQNGLRINGQQIKLKGGCMHHDNGPLGSKAIDRAEERKVELMKAQGFNAIRTSHNPPSPALLDAADRLGMLVLDEAFDQWSQSKNPDDYHRFFKDWWQRDIDAMVLRDRNHPSVIMWSIGNEIPERETSVGATEAMNLAAQVRRLDTTRPVTAAYNSVSPKADAFFMALDVAGYNYNPEHFREDHARVPNRVMVTTESYPYQIYDYWHEVEKMPWVIGDFEWTALDYIGESGVGHANLDTDLQSYLKPWPWHLANCGDIDICGFKRPQSFYRDVVWGHSKLEMAVHSPRAEGHSEVLGPWGWPDETHHWTWPGHEGETLQVNVYSSYPKVRLLLNGNEIGTKFMNFGSKLASTFAVPYPPSAAKLGAEFALPYVPDDQKLIASFTVPYAPGELKAVGIGNNGEEETRVLTTSGAPVRLRLTADRKQIQASRNDLSYVTVEAVDASGQVEPTASMRVRFSVDGCGEIAAVGNGDPTDTDSFQTGNRRLYGGRALVVVRPSIDAQRDRRLSLRATAEGLEPGAAEIDLR